MIMHMSGTRANGEKYPPGFTPFRVEDWEGEHLIRGGMARQAAPPKLTPPAQEPHKAAGRDWGAGDAPAAPAAPDPVPGPAPAAPLAPADPQARPPAPGDPKQAWIDYAVARGMDEAKAAQMTKADLQSRFGPRL